MIAFPVSSNVSRALNKVFASFKFEFPSLESDGF